MLKLPYFLLRNKNVLLSEHEAYHLKETQQLDQRQKNVLRDNILGSESHLRRQRNRGNYPVIRDRSKITVIKDVQHHRTKPHKNVGSLTKAWFVHNILHLALSTWCSNYVFPPCGKGLLLTLLVIFGLHKRTPTQFNL
ncbi:uncharacterized protein LOC133204511 [Saccostrea echinata]|uniref:uncharacterized protein LOC133204511 n=1 Tax=Saccostrea echinata TaxID=191078 RepID=UPI002A83503C|nr:uncharacterized protein LOC133204511 [Saccostrea echinata]